MALFYDLSSPAIRVLSKEPYFSEVSALELEEIAKVVVYKTFDPDQVAIVEGDTSDGLYVVEKSWFKIIKISGTGREQVIIVFRNLT